MATERPKASRPAGRVIAIAAMLMLSGGAVPPPPSAGQPSDIRATLDRDMPGVLREAGIASLSIATIEDGRIGFAAAYGMQSDGVPATTATLYNIASLTKPLTAEVVLRLVSTGRLSLDEPVGRYWTDPDIARDPRRRLLTPRLLLSHRSGFPNWRTKGGLAFDRAPGGAWGYSGEGYQYVARFAERKTGQGFEALAARYLFTPAAMTSTAYTRRPWFEGRVAVPTDAAGKPMAPDFADTRNAADLVYTTPRDYAAFMVDVLNGARLSTEVARERLVQQTDMKAVTCGGTKAATCPPAVGFGFGWQLLGFPGGTVMMHTGKDPGVFTFACIDRGTRRGVVLFTNSDNGYKAVLPVLDRLRVRPEFLAFLRAEVG